MIVDSHCHLDFTNLFNQLDDVVKRAENNDVKYFLTICTTLKSFEKVKIIIEKYKNIYGTLGIHPHEAKNFSSIDSKFIINLKNEYKKIIGIGETGLDYYYNHSDKKIQKKIFIEHINAASELNIPLIVDDTIGSNLNINSIEHADIVFTSLTKIFSGPKLV